MFYVYYLARQQAEEKRKREAREWQRFHRHQEFMRTQQKQEEDEQDAFFNKMVVGIVIVSAFLLYLRFESEKVDGYNFMYREEMIEQAKARLMSDQEDLTAEKMSVRTDLSIQQLTRQRDLFQHCNKQSACVILFLPPLSICDASCRYNHLIELDEARTGDNIQHAKSGWLWSETGQQPKLESALGGIKGPKPVTVISKWNRGTGRSWTLEDSLDSNRDNIKADFIFECFSGQKGKGQLVDSDGMPKIVEIEPWDGSEASRGWFGF